MDAWTLHWLEASGGLAEFRQALTGEFDIACQAISRYLPAQDLLAIALDKGLLHTPCRSRQAGSCRLSVTSNCHLPTM